MTAYAHTRCTDCGHHDGYHADDCERESPVKLQEAEQAEFPPVPDDKVWCSIRGQLVGVSQCATDECVAPEMRPSCWLGHMPSGEVGLRPEVSYRPKP